MDSPLRRSPRLSQNYVQARSSAGGVVSLGSNSRSSVWSTREQELRDEGRDYLERAPQLRNRLMLDQEGEIESVAGTQMPAEIDLTSNRRRTSLSKRRTSPGLNILSQAAAARDTSGDESTDGFNTDYSPAPLQPLI